MKKLIYSKKFSKQERDPYIQENFEELIHRETEDEFWARLFKDRYDHKILLSDDRNKLREDHIKACAEFALTREIDIEIFRGIECICVNLSFDGMVNITELKESIGFADRVIFVPGIGERNVTLSLTYQTHKIVFFKKRNKEQD